MGNPKGTKSFSSWSEFTDFVNEMPIKTIQPFVSNFNAFAGEGFYGNVVQGLVIKQLEDVVFIFGIAIDGTLIFRKRNYPDVSTWEDPKIIIHSNNWHKIYFVTDLGELIGIATKENKGLSDSVQALNSTIYNISTGNKETALFKVCDYGSNINHILHIYSSPNGTLDSCNYIRVILSDKYIFVNKLFEKGYNSIRLFKDRKSFYVYVYSSVWTRTKIEVFSENPDLFYFTNVTDEISISDLEEISISWKI